MHWICRISTTFLMVLAGLMNGPHSASAEDFSASVYSYPSYLKDNPKQQELVEAFSAIVQADAPPTLNSVPDKPVRISVVFPGNQVSDYWRRTLVAMEERLQQAKVPYTVNSLFTASGTELRKQEVFIHQELQKKPDYMVFTLDALRHKAVIEKIIDDKGAKLFLQNITTPLKEWQRAQPFLYSGFDHEVGSKLLADEYIKRTGGEGNYAVFYGPRGYVSQMRGDTFIRYVTENSQLHVTSSFYVGFNREKARLAALRLFSKHKDLKFVYACSTDIALGIIDALKETGLLGKVMVNGWGGGSAELEQLAQGDLNFTVMRMNDDNGVAMADAIVMDLNGKGAAVPVVYSGSIQIVTGQDDAQTIEALKVRAFRYSLKKVSQ